MRNLFGTILVCLQNVSFAGCQGKYKKKTLGFIYLKILTKETSLTTSPKRNFLQFNDRSYRNCLKWLLFLSDQHPCISLDPAWMTATWCSSLMSRSRPMEKEPSKSSKTLKIWKRLLKWSRKNFRLLVHEINNVNYQFYNVFSPSYVVVNKTTISR